jgi:hypothetical protein
MYAVLGTVDLDTSRQEEAEALLNDGLVPRVKAMPGFVSGTWSRSLDGAEGRSLVLFESEEAAQGAADSALAEGPPAGAPITFRSFDVLEVVAQA